MITRSTTWADRGAVLLLLTTLVLGGCRTGTPYERPDVESLVGDAFVNQARGTAVPSAGGPWWTRIGDPYLDELVVTALDGNHDLLAAVAGEAEAEARYRVAAGDRNPNAVLSFSPGRSVTSTDIGRIYETNYRLTASVSWQADLFGRLRSAERAAYADMFASSADRAALAQSIVAGVVDGWIAIAIAERRLDLVNDIVRSRQDTLESVERRYRNGVAGTSAADVYLARENLAAARAAVPGREIDIALARIALDVLLGRKPGEVAYDAGALAEVPDPDRPPVGLPAALLDQRPDLLASEFRIMAANEDVSVALADLYPDLTLNAGGGWNADDLGDLFDADAVLGQIAGDLFVTVFDRRRIRANVDAARARMDREAALYGGDILQAMREVEDALIRDDLLREQIGLVRKQVEEARQAEMLSRERYDQGLEELINVLDTERRRQAGEDQLLLLQGDAWNARVALHLALGGDWTGVADDRPEANEG